jgi:hypothetical protein
VLEDDSSTACCIGTAGGLFGLQLVLLLSRAGIVPALVFIVKPKPPQTPDEPLGEIVGDPLRQIVREPGQFRKYQQ